MSNIKFGSVIGAVLNNAFSKALSAAEKTILKIGKTTEQLTQRQQRMGKVLARALSHPTRSLGPLKRHYDQIGQAIDNINAKQARYNTALTKQKKLTSSGKELIGKANATVATTYQNAKLIGKSVATSADFEDIIKDISIKSGLNKSDEVELGKLIRASALQTNQDVTVLANSVGVLAKNGTPFSEVKQYIPLLGQVITDLRVSEEEATAAFLSLRDMGVKSGKEMQHALNQLVWSGQQNEMGADGMVVAIGKSNNQTKKHSLIANSKDNITTPFQVGNASSAGALQNIFNNRMLSPKEQIKTLELSVQELSLALGDALLPPTLAIIKAVTPMVTNLSLWIQSNPKLVAGVIGLASALAVVKAAMLYTKAAILFVKVPLLSLGGVFAKKGLILEVFKAKLLLGKTAITQFSTILPKLGRAITFIGRTLVMVSRSFLLSPIGLAITGIALAAALIYKYWQPIKTFFSGVFNGIGEALSPVVNLLKSTFGIFSSLFAPLIPLFKTVWNWCKKLFEPFVASKEQLASTTSAGYTLGQVLGTVFNILLTPLKVILTVIGWLGEAIKSVFSWSPIELIENVWNSVTDFFGNTWESIKNLCGESITQIGQTILNWSPLSFFTDIFNSVLDWFGIDLSSNFIDAGSKLIDGLVSGITQKWNTVKETITNLGSSITAWFKEKLGIDSPDGVFNPSEENNTKATTPRINKKTKSANRVATDLLSVPPTTPINGPKSTNKTTQHQCTDSMIVHFSPNITVNGGSSNIKSQVTDAVKISFAEFERLMKQYQQRTKRVAYKGINS